MKLSEMIDVTPNYLNAVENGKNFPSPDVIQRIIEALNILPYQLFLEFPGDLKIEKYRKKDILLQELTYIKQQFIRDFDKIMEKYKG